jgi:hypothetical protein
MRKLRNVVVWLLFVWLTAGVPCFGENPWLIRINIPEFKLYLYHAGEVYQTFNVAVGKQGRPSPLGDFWIVNKVLYPTWYPPDGGAPVPAGPDNPLGKYWLGLNITGYGIHGNSAAWSIGTPASLGCFRLHNKDIQKLFELVPVGTSVQIVYQTVRASITADNTAWVEVFPDIYKWHNVNMEILKSVQALGWKYEPHRRALEELVKAKKPLKVEVPRVIQTEGETVGVDGFYWNQEVYIAQKYLEALALKPAIINSNPLFTGYVKLDIRSIKENSQYFWDSESNTLRIVRIKVLLNGLELSDAACWNKDNQLVVNLKSIAARLGVRFYWDYNSKAFICNGVMVPGEPRENGFWVTPEELTQIWPQVKIRLDRKDAVLELEIG